ncbi:hypothetical protein CgunFtcFv8_016919 [Champsocephalus gunnari]|uniref:Uncharacterized protein n=1 Tax=Champsocephalus gunnari TaxID=52237 RepID=A0AAN8HAX3_CHAGU|nr:hypothetical protein CgunFtcFv8_016919 [Champsocephalus gunnari]
MSCSVFQQNKLRAAVQQPAEEGEHLAADGKDASPRRNSEELEEQRRREREPFSNILSFNYSCVAPDFRGSHFKGCGFN